MTTSKGFSSRTFRLSSSSSTSACFVNIIQHSEGNANIVMITDEKGTIENLVAAAPNVPSATILFGESQASSECGIAQRLCKMPANFLSIFMQIHLNIFSSSA